MILNLYNNTINEHPIKKEYELIVLALPDVSRACIPEDGYLAIMNWIS